MQNDFDFSLLVVAGFPRTGTTSIYRNLELHPGFAVPVRKELNFFCKPNQSLASYETYFPNHRQDQIRVDVSPAYCLDLEVPERLRTAVPHARVVLTLRDPAVWIKSLYTQMCSFTPHPPTFAEFLDHPQLDQFNQTFQFSLKEGIYRSSVSAFAKAFRENLLVIDFAAFERNPLTTLKEIEAIAGAPAYFNEQTVDARQHNSSKLARRHHPRLRWLLGKEGVVHTASKVVPAPLLRRARWMLYYESDNTRTAAAAKLQNEQEAKLARAATTVDREAYEEMFSAKPIRRGSEFC